MSPKNFVFRCLVILNVLTTTVMTKVSTTIEPTTSMLISTPTLAGYKI